LLGTERDMTGTATTTARHGMRFGRGVPVERHDFERTELAKREGIAYLGVGLEEGGITTEAPCAKGAVQYSKTEVYASFIMLLSGEQ